MLVEVGGDEGVVEGLDGGENQRGGGGDGGQNLVADGDSADEGLGVVSDDVSVDPGGRGGVGGTNRQELVVWDADDDANLGPRQGFEDVLVRIVDANVCYLLQLKERDKVRGRWKVGDVGADVDAHEWKLLLVLDLLLKLGM